MDRAFPRNTLTLNAVVLVAVIALLALLALRQISSHDMGFHLRAGDWILEGNGWPRNDAFTFTVNDRPYIDTSWGYQVVVALLERAAGSAGIVLFHVVLVAAVFGVLGRTARLVAPGSWLVAPLMLLGGLAAEPRFESRPETWSWLLLALVLDRLQRHAEGRRPALWPLVPLFLVWANSHSLFIIGWAVMACFVLGLALRDRRIDRRLAAWCGGAVAITLVNPYGWRAPLFALGLGTRMQRSNPFAQNIGEFQPPLRLLFSDELHFYVIPLVAWSLFLAAVAFSTVSLWKRRRIASLLLVVVFLPLSLTMVRNTPLLTLTCLPGAVWGLSEARRLSTRVAWGVPLATALAVALLVPRVVTDAYYVQARRQQRFGLDWNRLVLPVEVAAWAERAGLQGRVLNHLNFGGYLMWARPQPVFVDSRLEVMGETFYRRYLEALSSPQGLAAAVRSHGIRWIVFPYRLRPDLTAGLSRHPGWRLAYVDQLAAAFVPDEPGVEAVIDPSARAALEPTPVALDTRDLPGLGGPARPRRLSRWARGLLRRQSYPDEAFNLGVFHTNRHDPARAAWQFGRAIEQSDGAYYEIYANLGVALAALGRPQEARECYRLVLAELPFYRVDRRRRTRELLAEIEALLD